MKKIVAFALGAALGLLALIQVVRLIGRDSSDKLIAAILLAFCLASLFAVYRWAIRR